MSAKSSDKDPLVILNKLRQLENRKLLVTLPSIFKSFDYEKLQASINYWEEQIQIHEELKSTSKEYNNRIILNETEQLIYSKNKRFPDRKTQYLKYNQVADREKGLYFPHGLVDPEEHSFITDTEAIYIQSLTVVTVQNKNICLAKHSIPDCISFIPGKADLSPKAATRKRDPPDPSLILESRLRSQKGETKKVPSPPKSKQFIPKKLDFSNINLSDATTSKGDIKKEISDQALSTSILQEHELQDNLPDFEEDQDIAGIDTESFHSPLQSPKSSTNLQIEKEAKPKLQKLAEIKKQQILGFSGTSSINIDPVVPKTVKEKPILGSSTVTISNKTKMGQVDEEAVRLLEARIDALTKHMEELYNQGRPRPTPRNPSTSGDDNDIEFLRSQLQKMELSQQPVRQVVSTDKETIMELKNNIADMANCMNKLQEVIEQNKLTPEEKQKLKMMSGPTSAIANPLVYKINYPTNIIDNSVYRGAISVMKPTSIIATIGIFDPDINPKSNFREIWERIQNYTRNFDLYEHEYVDILMILMKGSAASCLTDMIREYGGNLSKILEAIQDIYIPQHTIFDDMDELNKFSRPANENIKTTMRRAALIINRLKNQCAPAAWNERRYHMLLALIKQVIDKETFRHLYAEELKCAQAGTQLDIPAIITIISLHEQTHDLVPKRELRLQYNINSMQVIEHDDRQIKTMTVTDKHEKRLGNNKKERSRTKELVRTPNKRSESRERYQPSSQSQHIGKRNDHQRYRSSSTSDVHDYSQRNSQGDRNYRSKSPYDTRRSQSDNRSQSRDRYRSASRERSYKNSAGRNQDRSRKQKKSYNNNGSNRNNKNTSPDKPSYEKSFKHGKNMVTLHFYKCLTCPSMHPTGSNCDKNNEITSLNM